MSSKWLFPLAAVLMMLILAAVVLKRQSVSMRLSDEAGFEPLVPPTLRADRINGLHFFQGAKPEEILRLRRQDGAWVATSHYNAPIQADKIKRFLTTLSSLEGELRSDKAELLPDFHLDTAQALHVQIYTDNSETPMVHLLASKSRGRHGFMRIADTNSVYSVDLNLHNEAGLYGNNLDQSPQAKPWLDLQIQNVPVEQISALELHTPTRHWHFVRQQLTSSSPDAPQTAPATEPQWSLIKPHVEYPIKPGGLNGLVSTLCTLRAEDFANPDQIADYGLDPSTFRAILTVQRNNKDARQVTIQVGHEIPEQAGKRYARLGPEGPIYILSAWTFSQLFPQGKELLDLRILRIQPQEVTRLNWHHNGKSWTIERRSAESSSATETQTTSTWKLIEAPQTMVDTQKVDSLLSTIQNLTADDWLDHPSQSTDLVQFELALTLTLHDGGTKHLTLSKGNLNSYARVKSIPALFIIPTPTYTTLTDMLKALLSSQSASAFTSP